MVEGFQSSDSLRGAKPLPYAQHVQLGPVALEMGARLSDVTVCYETYGTLNATRDNPYPLSMSPVAVRVF